MPAVLFHALGNVYNSHIFWRTWKILKQDLIHEYSQKLSQSSEFFPRSLELKLRNYLQVVLAPDLDKMQLDFSSWFLYTQMSNNIRTCL